MMSAAAAAGGGVGDSTNTVKRQRQVGNVARPRNTLLGLMQNMSRIGEQTRCKIWGWGLDEAWSVLASRRAEIKVFFRCQSQSDSLRQFDITENSRV